MTCQLKIGQCGRLWPLVEKALIESDDILVVGFTRGTQTTIFERFAAFSIPWVTMIDVHRPNVDLFNEVIEQARDSETEFKGVRADVRDVVPPGGTIQDVEHLCELDTEVIKLANRNCSLYVWQHGPEHLDKAEAVGVIKEMQHRASVGVILEVPIGELSQPADLIADNPAEVHLSEWQPEDFEALGFSAEKSYEGDYVIAVWLKNPISEYASLVGASPVEQDDGEASDDE